MHVAKFCLVNVPLSQLWSLANQFPDSVSRLLVHQRLIGNSGLKKSYHGSKSEICHLFHLERGY